VSEISNQPVTLEGPDGSITPVQTSLSFGRAQTNHIVVGDDGVSRRHALIYSQGESEFWLEDLRSSNGTYLNEQRILQGVRLKDGDRIRIGHSLFVFRQPGAGVSPAREMPAGPITEPITVEISTDCWLLIGDIIGSTELVRTTPPNQWAKERDHWLMQCKQLVESSGGSVNNYLGDGFLAFAPASLVSAERIAGLVRDVQKLQLEAALPFRFVLHFGKTFIGGASVGGETLSGLEVTFAFRMEELASALGILSLLSEPAEARLGHWLPTAPQGYHRLTGFADEFPFYAP